MTGFRILFTGVGFTASSLLALIALALARHFFHVINMFDIARLMRFGVYGAFVGTAIILLGFYWQMLSESS